MLAGKIRVIPRFGTSGAAAPSLYFQTSISNRRRTIPSSSTPKLSLKLRWAKAGAADRWAGRAPTPLGTQEDPQLSIFDVTVSH